MKIKAACIGVPPLVVDALSGTEFASEVLQEVIGEALGVKNVLNRPAEYYVQFADVGPAPKQGMMGIEVRLTGVSRNGRKAKQFHDALIALERIVEKMVMKTLDRGKKCQIFCVIMIDGDVETSPGSGNYSSNLESEPVWVKGMRRS